MITDVNLLIEKFDNLESLLSQYSKLTNRLSSTDIEEVEETDIILAEREMLIDQMKLVRPQITELINRQTSDKADAIKKMMSGETVISDFSHDEKSIQSKILRLRSIQRDIIEKDNACSLRFKRKFDEIRSNLEDLQRDKKRINFYQNMKINGKGAAFDSQS